MTPIPITLTKHHGLGNDFLIAIEPGRSLDPTDAVRWCDRRRGIGADGLIASEPLSTDGTTWSMTLWNADGSRAEVSGNGLRCLGQALARHRPDLAGSDGSVGLTIRTDAGLRPVDVGPDRRRDVAQVRVDMGAAGRGPHPSTRWPEAGLTPIEQIGVDLGNPHLVALVDDPDRYDITAVGPTIEAEYRDGCNVHLVAASDRATLRMVPWERGAGATQACGSGACASAWAAHHWGVIDDTVEVVMPGGRVTVELGGDTIKLTGPAAYVGTITVDD